MTDIEDFGPGHLWTKSVQMGELLRALNSEDWSI